ncbi:MAG: SprT family zinc-dependent metalloprotease [Planctomycetota bacterium]
MAKEAPSPIQFGGTTIWYEVIRRRGRKSVSIVIDPDDGVLVIAPKQAAAEYLAGVVERRANWIVTKLAEVNSVALPIERDFVNGERYHYLGRQFELRLVKAERDSTPVVRLTAGRFTVTADVGRGDGRRRRVVRSALVEWYREHALVRLGDRVECFADRLGLTPGKLLIRQPHKRWASCDRDGNLRFNWRIIMAPMLLVDYVVAHELCHLKHPDHSPAYWRMLRAVMPTFEHRRERLRQNGPRYGF